MKELEKYFRGNTGNMIYKWVHYFDVYERHFKSYRKKPVTVLEFGVMHGGSLQMWKEYFGSKARIIGVDINPDCKKLQEKQIEIHIGDQGDHAFLQKLREAIGPIDIIIDDGGHTMEQQMTTFKELWPALNDGGIYVVEDTHTSYNGLYGGGYPNQDTFVEFTKELIDQMHAWYTHAIGAEYPQIDRYTRSVSGIHTYGSVIVFDKANVDWPHDEQYGKDSGIKFSYLGTYDNRPDE